MPPGDEPGRPTGLEEYLDQPVVIDTRSTYVILVTLRRIDRDYLTLEDVDVHDGADGHSKTTKDRYIMDASKLGICANRAATKVRAAEIVSISLLRDVQTF